jgi:hypothetical protein
VEQLKEQLDAAVTTLGDINKQYEQKVTTFNARTDAAQAEIDASNTNYETKLVARNTQQDSTFKARDDFNIAALHLADEVQLCAAPQPPAECEHGVEQAEDAVKAMNATQVTENAKLVTANAALDDAFDQQQMASAACVGPPPPPCCV